MASDLSFVEFICDQVRQVDRVSYRKMFGEYAIYVGTKMIALVCDNRLFLKPTEAGRALLGTPDEAPPYPGAKPWFVVDDYIDDADHVTRLFLVTESEVPEPKPKQPKTRRRPGGPGAG